MHKGAGCQHFAQRTNLNLRSLRGAKSCFLYIFYQERRTTKNNIPVFLSMNKTNTYNTIETPYLRDTASRNSRSPSFDAR